MIKFLKRGFAVLSGNLSISISNFLISGILISKNGLDNYGLFVVLQSCYVVWITISKPVTWQTIVKFSPAFDLHTLTKASLRIEFIGALASTAVLVTSLSVLSFYYTWISNYLISILTILLGSLIVNNGTFLGYLRTNRNYSTVASIQISSAILKVVASLTISSDIETYFIATVAIDIALWGTGIIYTIYTHNPIKTNRANPAPSFPELVKFSYWGTFHAALDLPVSQLDKILISSLIGLEAAGVLDIIKKLSQVAGQFAAPIYQIIFPEYTKLLHEQKTKSLLKLSVTLSAAILACGIALVVATNFAFNLINNYAFSNHLLGYKKELIAYLIIQSLALCFIWAHPLCISLGKMKQTAYILIASNTVYLATIYLFAEKHSITAVIFAFTLQSSTLIAAKVYIIIDSLRADSKKQH